VSIFPCTVLLEVAQNLPHEKMCHTQESKCGKCAASAICGTGAENRTAPNDFQRYLAQLSYETSPMQMCI